MVKFTFQPTIIRKYKIVILTYRKKNRKKKKERLGIIRDKKLQKYYVYFSVDLGILFIQVL